MVSTPLYVSLYFLIQHTPIPYLNPLTLPVTPTGYLDKAIWVAYQRFVV